MRKFAYRVVKRWLRGSLFLYYSRIKVYGLENLPKDKPVLLVCNHQNAFLDALTMAADRGREPYFITRGDVFNNKTIRAIFEFLQMIPIFRIRDGKRNVNSNQAIFDRCAQLLLQGETVLIYPEGNHSLQRHIRPLSKGFTRIIYKALESNPNLDLYIVPVGVNYQHPPYFRDRTALYYGTPILMDQWYDPKEQQQSVENIKGIVREAMEGLTTHVPDLEQYDNVINKLHKRGVDFTKPQGVNALIESLDNSPEPEPQYPKKRWWAYPIDALFTVLNLPLVLLWRKKIKPLFKDPAFYSSARFMICFLGFPIYFLLLLGVLWPIFGFAVAAYVILGIILFNFLYVKGYGLHHFPEEYSVHQ